jgi:hypothetical protein
MKCHDCSHYRQWTLAADYWDKTCGPCLIGALGKQTRFTPAPIPWSELFNEGECK